MQELAKQNHLSKDITTPKINRRHPWSPVNYLKLKGISWAFGLIVRRRLYQIRKAQQAAFLRPSPQFVNCVSHFLNTGSNRNQHLKFLAHHSKKLKALHQFLHVFVLLFTNFISARTSSHHVVPGLYWVMQLSSISDVGLRSELLYNGSFPCILFTVCYSDVLLEEEKSSLRFLNFIEEVNLSYLIKLKMKCHSNLCFSFFAFEYYLNKYEWHLGLLGQ